MHVSFPSSCSCRVCVHKTPGGTSWRAGPGGDPGGGVGRVCQGASGRPGPAWSDRGWVRCGSVVSSKMGHMGRRRWRTPAMVDGDGPPMVMSRANIATAAGPQGRDIPQDGHLATDSEPILTVSVAFRLVPPVLPTPASVARTLPLASSSRTSSVVNARLPVTTPPAGHGTASARGKPGNGSRGNGEQLAWRATHAAAAARRRPPRGRRAEPLQPGASARGATSSPSGSMRPSTASPRGSIPSLTFSQARATTRRMCPATPRGTPSTLASTSSPRASTSPATSCIGGSTAP